MFYLIVIKVQFPSAIKHSKIHCKHLLAKIGFKQTKWHWPQMKANWTEAKDEGSLMDKVTARD